MLDWICALCGGNFNADYNKQEHYKHCATYPATENSFKRSIDELERLDEYKKALIWIRDKSAEVCDDYPCGCSYCRAKAALLGDDWSPEEIAWQCGCCRGYFAATNSKLEHYEVCECKE